ncbi:MAG TPA: hypothetical protein ENL15_00560 [Firmicutes bacterium]|nr:hypothetical protein [Bacillota bacterium]
MKRFVSFLLFMAFLLPVAAGSEGISPAKAFFYSLAVPGLGQYINGQKVKGESFMVAEALSVGLMAYFSYRSDLSVDRYISYADTHFYYEGDDPERKSYTEMWELLRERVYAKTNLPYEKVGEYYELIGKLPELTQFWDEPAQQAYYYDMRQEANRLYKTKNTFLAVLIANHVISAVDAFIGASKGNLGLSGGIQENGGYEIGVEVKL